MFLPCIQLNIYSEGHQNRTIYWAQAEVVNGPYVDIYRYHKGTSDIKTVERFIEKIQVGYTREEAAALVPTSEKWILSQRRSLARETEHLRAVNAILESIGVK